jgi:hypothetical protein
MMTPHLTPVVYTYMAEILDGWRSGPPEKEAVPVEASGVRSTVATNG